MENEFYSVMREYIDINNTENRRYLLGLDEAGKNLAAQNLTSRLYDKIVEHVDDIDFGSIPKSRGDITKIENYDSLVECVNLIREIIKGYNQPTETIDIVSTAIDNIKNRERTFSKCFVLKKEYPMVIYNVMTLSVVSAVSFLIKSCIEFIKTPGNETYEIAIDKTAYKNSMQHVLIKNLALFNESCRNGELDRSIAVVIGGKSEVMEASIVTPIITMGAVFIQMIKNIIPMLQQLVFYFYHAKMTVSDYFAAQADLLQMNAANVTYKTNISEENKSEIIKRQNKIATAFRKISNAFDINDKKAVKAVEKDIKNNNFNIKKEDLYNDTESLF